MGKREEVNAKVGNENNAEVTNFFLTPKVRKIFLTCTVKRKRKTEKNFYVAHPSALRQHITDPTSHSVICRYFECVCWATLHLHYAATTATVSIIVGGGTPHHHPHPTTPPSTSVAIFVTLFRDAPVF